MVRLADHQQEAVSHIPTAAALALTSNQTNPKAPLPPNTASGTTSREAWMLEPAVTAPPIAVSRREIPQSASLTEGYGDDEGDARLGRGVDFFSSMGTEHKRKDPREVEAELSRKKAEALEINKQSLEGKSVDEYEDKGPKKVQPGGPGHQWRMMKLKRLYEQAAEECVILSVNHSQKLIVAEVEMLKMLRWSDTAP